jgi:cellulose synthase/poly-beta-1,6-N-acetylglucosamine synthase-like glycosyltransferase
VVSCGEHNISAVRNAGASATAGDLLVFIDADTLVPDTLFETIAAAMEDDRCVGGAVAVRYGPIARRWMALYLTGWRFWSRIFSMKQGAAQFCRRDAFEALGGYDQTIFMSEDIDFYWRLARFARQRGGHLRFIERPSVVTSTRRFDRISPWRTLLLTHPVIIRLARRRRAIHPELIAGERAADDRTDPHHVEEFAGDGRSPRDDALGVGWS